MTDSDEKTLEFQCPKCSKRLKAGGHVAGKKVKCPKCGSAVRVPGVQAAQKVADDWLSMDDPLQSPGKGGWSAGGMAAEADVDSSGVSSGGVELPELNAPAINVSEIEAERRRVAEAAEAERASRRPFANRGSSPKKPANRGGERSAAGPAARGAAASAQERPTNQPGSQKASKSAAASAASADTASEETSAQPQAGQLHAKTGSAAGSSETPARSIFDDDLPDLAELEPASEQRSSSFSKLMEEHGLGGSDSAAETSRHPTRRRGRDSAEEDLPDLDLPDQNPLTGGNSAFAEALAEPLAAEPPAQYRIACPTCGTAQYVSPASKGSKIKCPDCYSMFKVPPPPKGWSPEKARKHGIVGDGDQVGLAKADDQQQREYAKKQKQRTSQMLQRAQQEMTEEELDELYTGHFDTADWAQRTFGFVKDPLAVLQIVVFGLAFACIFGITQWLLDQSTGQFGLGYVLLACVGMPIVGILFALPMLSSGLALLESVANQEPKVREWPGFNLFDNIGDVLAVGFALVISMLPGYLIGSWIGGFGEGAEGRIQIGGMMATSFVLFPVVLLSILDNGSVFQPASRAVFRSLSEAAEPWGGYYLKTLVAFALVMLVWFILLGKNPILSAIGGALLPMLTFFTCQQIGALADGISEHLSFEFAPPEEDADDAEPGSS